MCCLIHPGCTRLWRKTHLPQKRTSVTLRSHLFNTKPSAVAEVTFLLSWFFSWHKISTSSCFFQDSWFTFIQGTSLLFVWKFSVPLKLVVSFKAFLYDVEKSKCVGARSYLRTEYMELLKRKKDTDWLTGCSWSVVLWTSSPVVCRYRKLCLSLLVTRSALAAKVRTCHRHLSNKNSPRENLTGPVWDTEIILKPHQTWWECKRRRRNHNCS